MPIINIFLVDDHPLFIEGVKIGLENYKKKIQVVGSANSSDEALEKLDQLDVDIVLLDLMMPVVNGAICCQLIKEKHPDIKVIALTGEMNSLLLHDAWKNDIDSIVNKYTGKEELYNAIVEVSKGRRFFSEGLPDFIFPDKKSLDEDIPTLTRRERDVLLKMAQNLTKEQIADELCISPGGVKFHIKNIYRKFNVHKETDLMTKARELRYVQ